MSFCFGGAYLFYIHIHAGLGLGLGLGTQTKMNKLNGIRWSWWVQDIFLHTGTFVSLFSNSNGITADHVPVHLNILWSTVFTWPHQGPLIFCSSAQIWDIKFVVAPILWTKDPLMSCNLWLPAKWLSRTFRKRSPSVRVGGASAD